MTSIHTDSGKMQNSRLLLLALLLTLIAALPRLYNLGELGFYMDEETTAFASRSMAEGMHPQMPSGMPYHRAILHSWMNALSAKAFGLDNEFSYRLPAAIFGILTIPLLFLLARPYVGTPAAFLVALLLALSEWHIFTSRQARMYAPFLFFYIASVFSILRWAQSDRNGHLVLAIVLFALSASLHQFGIFAAFIPIAALLIQNFCRTPTYKLLLFSSLGGLSALLYGRFYIDNIYLSWKSANGIEMANTTAANSFAGFQALDYRLLIAGFVSVIPGIWLARKSAITSTGNGEYIRIAAHYCLAVLFAVLAATARIHGALLSMLLMLFIYPGSLTEFLKSAYKPIIVIAAVTALSSSLVLTNAGLIPGIKSMFTLPHQYWTLMIDLTPGITLLFLLSLGYLALGNRQTVGKSAYIMAICALIPLILIGIIKNWVPARYIITAYPFILVMSGLMLFLIVQHGLAFFRATSETAVTTGALAIILSGVLGGHGAISAYRAATLTYGDQTNQEAHIFPVHPDHKHTGEFVAAHSNSNDIIIAEDVIQQQWYAERVDYWLRDPQTHKKYLFSDTDNELHDIYVNSIVATPEVLNKLLALNNKRIWLITSGETFHQRQHYLSKKQRLWLETIEKNNQPVFTGKDNISFVYCLNCENSQ